jgi:nicotinamide-nucleotide amidase
MDPASCGYSPCGAVVRTGTVARTESREVVAVGDEELQSTVEAIAEAASEKELTVAVAESLTSGTVAKTLGAGPNASSWFAGGVVAYQPEVKFAVLGVDEGPVVTERCASQLAAGVKKMFGVDAVVSATGVGGPDPSEGKPAGTVVICGNGPGGEVVRELHVAGDPDQVLDGTVRAAVELLKSLLDDA